MFIRKELAWFCCCQACSPVWKSNFLDTKKGNWEYHRSPETARCCIKVIWLAFQYKTDLHWNWLKSRITIPHPRLRMLLGKPACLACRPYKVISQRKMYFKPTDTLHSSAWLTGNNFPYIFLHNFPFIHNFFHFCSIKVSYQCKISISLNVGRLL